MLLTLWTWIKNLFKSKKVGILLAIFAKKTTVPVIDAIMDPDNQQKAYDFVNELRLRNDISTSEKAKLFNKQMLEWAKSLGKILSSSAINCLRELAVNALKAKLGRGWYEGNQKSK